MSSKKVNKIFILVVGVLFLLPGLLKAEGNKKDGNTGIKKVSAQTAVTYLDINNISTYFYNNGISDIAPSGNSGFVYPKGSGKTAVFTSGLLWGATVNDSTDIRVGGTAYRTGIQPGVVLSNGTADVSTLDKYRIYRVRPDVYPGGPEVDLTADAANELTTVTALRSAYEKDWTEWPAQLGAPYTDVNNNGVYDAGDIPGVPGADQTVWFVGNDLSSNLTTNLYNSGPLGIEVQATFWAYNKTGALGNTYFRKYRLINITNRTATPTTFKNMYVSMWSDVDLGDAGDDFVGVDTTLSLQYCYNANAIDKVFAPLPPPAVGFDFFQGPIVATGNPADSAIFNNKRIGGYKNLPMTAAYYFANGDPNIGDPPQGTSSTADGYRQFYNFFRGRYGVSGAPFIDPTTGQITTYALSGDPQKGTGWLDGKQLPAGDRRQGSASGPFNMAPGDTQEVVVAELIGGAIPGTDRLSAIGILKFYDQQAQLAYDNFFNLPSAPPAPHVAATGLNQEIVLDWGEDANAVQATETSSSNGYTFQGYNVYQLPSATSTVESGVRVATFDRIDGVGKIEDKFFDPSTGVVAIGVRQFGNDTGIKRYVQLTQDAVKGGTPLINGIKYYFAVTSYNYNPDPNAVPNNLENPITILTVVPHTNDPGVTQASTETKSAIHTGTADADVDVTIVDPTKLTGHNYKVDFNQSTYVQTPDLKWHLQTPKRLGKKGDVSPSTMSFTGTFPGNGSISVVGTMAIVAPGADFVDGVQVTLPAGVTVVSADNVTDCYPGSRPGNTVNAVITGNKITWGDSSRSGFGCFDGSQTVSFSVSGSLPFDLSYKIYDDGYDSNPLDAVGTFTLGAPTQVQNQWSLTDVTAAQTLLSHQTVFGGVDVYSGIGAGGSSNPLLANGGNIGTDASGTVDGFQVNVSGSFDAPLNYSSVTLGSSSNSTLTQASSTTTLDIQNYTIFGGTISSKAIDNFGVGTNDIDELQQDYQLRFTGVRDSTTIGAQKIYTTKDGTGSLATVFGTSAGAGAGMDILPTNPNPGTNAPFLIRVPFEVWNVDQNIQVNMMFRERVQSGTENPYYTWNYTNREYAVLVNSPYDSTTPQPFSTTAGTPALATWVLVFYGTNYNKGDTVFVKYANPIQLGKDEFTFATQASSYNSSLAKTDVNKINVFPNPYYGVNSEELNKYNRFVTFSHLPTNATIRIFNLAGVLVRTVVHSGGDQFQRWDLQNESGLPVASGMYIAYIDMPDLGTSKILKFAIIQEQQFLDRF